jgi:hypothetical protein
VVDPEDGPCHFAPAGPDQAGEHYDLTSVHSEGHVGEDALSAQVLDGEDHIADSLPTRASPVDYLAPHHRLDKVVCDQPGERPGEDMATVAHHRHPLAEVEDFLEAMGDEEHRFAFAPERLDHLEESVDLVGGK